MSARARWEKLEPRERRLLAILGALLGALVLLGIPAAVLRGVAASRAENERIRELVRDIQAARAQVAERKARHDALLARYAKPAPPLAGFIEEAAKANGIAVPESQDRPVVPHGKRYTERVTVVKMHKVGMLALAKTLEKIEQSGYPVAITRLNIKPRAGEPDSYQVELGVSAFDRKGEGASGAAAASSPAVTAEEPEGEEEPE